MQAGTFTLACVAGFKTSLPKSKYNTGVQGITQETATLFSTAWYRTVLIQRFGKEANGKKGKNKQITDAVYDLFIWYRTNSCGCMHRMGVCLLLWNRIRSQHTFFQHQVSDAAARRLVRPEASICFMVYVWKP